MSNILLIFYVKNVENLINNYFFLTGKSIRCFVLLQKIKEIYLLDLFIYLDKQSQDHNSLTNKKMEASVIPSIFTPHRPFKKVSKIGYQTWNGADCDVMLVWESFSPAAVSFSVGWLVTCRGEASVALHSFLWSARLGLSKEENKEVRCLGWKILDYEIQKSLRGFSAQLFQTL